MKQILRKIGKYAGLSLLALVLVSCVLYTIGDIAYRSMFQPHHEQLNKGSDQ